MEVNQKQEKPEKQKKQEKQVTANDKRPWHQYFV